MHHPRNDPQVKERLKCSYCAGTGQITCGRCYGAKLLEIRDASAPGGFAKVIFFVSFLNWSKYNCKPA